MSHDEMSPERSRAHHRFREAEQQASKGHLKEAIDIARDVLEIDPTYTEIRHWIAKQYEKSGEPRRAAIEYQEILHGDRDDAEAWERLRELDPAAADRLERLHNIAPDPFVVQRTAAVDDGDLDDLAGLAEELGDAGEEETFVPGHEPGAEVTDSLEDLEGTDAIEALVGDEAAHHHAVELEEMGAEESEDWSLEAPEAEETPMAAEPEPTPPAEAAAESGEEWAVPQEATAPAEATAEEAPADWSMEPEEPCGPAEPGAAAPTAPPALTPDIWLYEEDVKYRDLLAANDFVANLVVALEEFWHENDTWDTNISGLAHLDHHRHEKVCTAFVTAAHVFGIPQWVLYFSPERRMVPTILRGKPNVGTVTTGIMNTLSSAELLFMAGRMSSLVACERVGYLQATLLVLDRTPRTITDVERDMMDLLRDRHSGVQGLHRDERQILGALCHAWQLRAALSADRAGLLCCRDLDAACNAIARGVSLDSNAAQMVSWRALREKYQGQDLAKLAGIAPKEDPQRDEGYGYYRIRMLRWWAGTEPAQQLLGGGGTG